MTEGGAPVNADAAAADDTDEPPSCPRFCRRLPAAESCFDSTLKSILCAVCLPDKPIGASPRRWLDSSCCLGLLGLLCCDHDDRVFPYNGYGNSMSIYVRNPSASLK